MLDASELEEIVDKLLEKKSMEKPKLASMCKVVSRVRGGLNKTSVQPAREDLYLGQVVATV